MSGRPSSVATPNATLPICPHCRQTIDPKRDLLWENTGGQLSMRGVTIVYCAWCGTILGTTNFQTFTKTRRE
jgi:hypothetical protein